MLITKNYNYLSQVPFFKSGLPSGYLINKGKVGCGGTTVALSSNKDTIVCVPFVSLIQNKCSQNPNILGVYEGIKDSEIEYYIAHNNIRKIMCTYDSLERVSKITGYDYYLLVDELHLLFTNYCFRNKAVKSVLKLYSKFREWSFLTATPIEDDFMLEELKDIPKFNIDWEDKTEIKVKAIKCTKVLSTTKNIILDYLNDKMFGNAHIFVNSVDIIAKLITTCKLDNSNTRIIFSKSNSKYSNTCCGIINGNTTDSVKKINLYTSTCFEGCDLYDEDGKIYIVSSSSKAQTLLDISTSIRQIAGRIRNTKYHTIVHLYNNTRYSKDISYEEYREYCFKEIENIKEYCKLINQNPLLRDGTKESTYPYVVKEDIFTFDSNLLKIDLFNFRCTHYIYSLNINSEYTKNGFEVFNDIDTVSDKLLKNPSRRTTFKEAILEYDSLVSNKYNLKRLDTLIAKYPYIKEAYDKLGMNRIKELNYKGIKKELIKIAPIKESIKITKLLNIKIGDFITGKEIKSTLETIYSELGITTKPTLNTFKEFAILESKIKKINGKTTKGYIIKYLKY